VFGCDICNRRESPIRLTMSSITAVPTIVLPRREPKRPRRSRAGMTSAMEEEMKMIPTRRAGAPVYPKRKAMMSPATKGMMPLMLDMMPMFFPNCFMEERRIFNPATNMRKINPKSLMKFRVSFGSRRPNPNGPITIPPMIRAMTQGTCNFRTRAENTIPTSSTIKKGRMAVISLV